MKLLLKVSLKEPRQHGAELTFVLQFEFCVSPPAEGVTMFETAGIDEATVLLQPLDDILVSIL